MIKKCVVIGAGGHARVLIDCIEHLPDIEIVGLLTPELSLRGTYIYSIPVLGDDVLLPSLFEMGVGYFVIGLGGTGDNRPRERLYERACSSGLEPLTVIHPSALISGRAVLNAGCQALAGCVINAGAHIGKNVLLNTGVIVEHDCVLGDHVHLATGALLTGAVKVGSFAHIGAGAIVRQGISIGDYAVVGAGAVVVKDVAVGDMVAGVPAKLLKKVDL